MPPNLSDAGRLRVRDSTEVGWMSVLVRFLPLQRFRILVKSLKIGPGFFSENMASVSDNCFL